MFGFQVLITNQFCFECHKSGLEDPNADFRDNTPGDENNALFETQQ